MNKDMLILGAVTFGVLLAVGIILINPETSVKEDAPLSTTKTSEGEVSVVLTPQSFAKGQFTVAITLDTHSVDLSAFDLKDIITLESRGQSYSPITSPSLSGHHVSGSLAFALPEQPDEFAIIIRDLPDNILRRITWP